MGVANVLADCVLVTSSTTGTGTYSLGGAVSDGFLAPSEVLPSLAGQRVSYRVQDSLNAPASFEVVEGVLSSGAPWTLTRATIRRSKAGGVAGSSAVNWPVGTRYIFITPIAANTPQLDTDGWLAAVRLLATADGSAGAPAIGWSSDPDSGLYRISADVVGFAVAGAEQMRLSSGVLRLGAQAPLSPFASARLWNNGFIASYQPASGATAGVFWNAFGSGTQTLTTYAYGGAGATVGSVSTDGSTTTYNTSSDERLKRDLRPLTAEAAEGMLRSYAPRLARYVTQPSDSPLRPVYLAHEVQHVLPHAAQGERDAVDAGGAPVMMTAAYDPHAPLLHAALLGALDRIAALESRLAAIKAGGA